MAELQEVTLENLNDGVAGVLFRREYQRVMDNIDDVATSATAKRTITIKIVFAPVEDREMLSISVDASTKLASVKPSATLAQLVKKNGHLMAVTPKGVQLDAFIDGTLARPEVRPNA